MASDGTSRRRLRLLVGGVVLAAAGCLGWALTHLPDGVPAAYLVAGCGLVAVAGLGTVYVRVRSQTQYTTTSAAVLAALIVLPPAWALIAVAVGVAAAKAVRRAPWHKSAFNTAKEILAATAGLAAAHATGLVPVTVADASWSAEWPGWLLALAVAGVAYTAVDEVLPYAAIALATGTRWRQVATRAADIRAVSRGVDLVAAAATVALVAADPRLVVAMPAGMTIAYLLYRQRLTVREERAAWQQLATATDALAASIAGDLTKVLHTAVRHATALFPAAIAEAEHDGRLVRADPGGAVIFDGPAADAPPIQGATVEAGPPAGIEQPAPVLRLRLPRDPRVADREPHLLHTLRTAMDTAVRNTIAHTSVVELSARHHHDAGHDPLTGLPNRRHLVEHLSGLLAEAGPERVVALLLLDLDHFKEVNDSIGHTAGDAVLVEVARRLQAADPAALVARLGGDEFAIVYTLTSPSPTLASTRGEQWLRQLRQPYALDGVPVAPDASAGIALAADPTTTHVELLRRADVAMYRAKGEAHRPLRLAVYNPSDRSEANRLTLRAAVPAAAATGAWELRYQPIVDLTSGRVATAAAQIRWHHYDLDHLSPDRCLGILQRAGRLHDYVRALLGRALADLSRWSQQGHDLAVSITLSPQAIAAPDLHQAIQTALADHGLDPRRLTIALTHTTGIGHNPPLDAGLADLHSAGVRIALDGTGSATLDSLHHLPVDELHISARLVADAGTSTKAVAVISALTELANRFGLPVCADGIEQHRQRQTLWELGATHGQGPLFGRPMTPQAMLNTLRHGPISRPLNAGGVVVRLPRRREHPANPA